MRKPAYEQLTLFRAGFLEGEVHVNHFPWLETKKVKKMTVTYGRKCSELSPKLSQLGYLLRMYLESSRLPGTQFARTWSVRVTKSGYLIMKLRLSERRTEGKECSLWATPNTMDSLPSRSYEAMKRQATNGGRKNRMRPGNLREQIDPLMCQAYTEARLEANGLWPTPKTRMEDCPAERKRNTPNLASAVMMFPTPTTQETEHSNLNLTETKRRISKNGQNTHSLNLADTVSLFPTPTTGAGLCGETGNFQQLQKLSEQGTITEEECKNMSQGNDGQLNPDWVEWLMGFPVGWTSLVECHE